MLGRAQVRRARRLRALGQAPYAVPVSFVIAGAQKAATSTLYRMLVEHPGIAAGPEKEMNFFNRETDDWSDPDYDHYVRPADNPEVEHAGDATPDYLLWPHAFERMRRYRPDLRVVVTVRDPVERALSQWCMERARRPDVPEFSDAVRRLASRHLPEELPTGVAPWEFRLSALFTKGLYGQQLRRCLASFDRRQVLVLDFADVCGDHVRTLDRVTDFLAVERFADHPALLHRNATRPAPAGAPLAVSDLERLVGVYADDLAELAALTGLDLNRWSTCRALSGELSLTDFTDRLAAKAGLAVQG